MVPFFAVFAAEIAPAFGQVPIALNAAAGGQGGQGSSSGGGGGGAGGGGGGGGGPGGITNPSGAGGAAGYGFASRPGSSGASRGGAGGTGGNSSGAGGVGYTGLNDGGAGGNGVGAAGQNGESDLSAGYGGGGGGGGGHGYVGGALPTSAVTGGKGGNGGLGYGTGGGGGGGFGAIVLNGGDLGTLTVNVTGGAGGTGGASTGGLGGAADGQGGAGLYFKPTSQLTAAISSTIRGGRGERGGAGIYVENGFGAMATLTLSGSAVVVGGSGDGWNYGIIGQNLNVVLQPGASVTGGTNSSGGQGGGVSFDSGTNVLELIGTGGISGVTYATITSASGSSANTDTLKFTGAGGVFDNSTIASAFNAFDSVLVNSTGTWSMTGTRSGTPVNIPWTVSGGALQVNGTILGTISLASGTTLRNPTDASGTATATQSITVQSGAHLAAYARTGTNSAIVSTTGALVINSGAIVDVSLRAPSTTALIKASTDLTLNGTLNIANTGGMAPGTYLLISYGGTYSGSGLTIGTTPVGVDYQYTLDTATAGKVNLLIAAPELYWNGTTVSGSTTAVVGGTGTWDANTGHTNWTNAGGTSHVGWVTGGVTAIFSGAAGTVTVDGSSGVVGAKGLQFLTTGYTITGSALVLADGSTAPKVDVVGTAVVAAVSTDLQGTNGLEKTGTGTLILGRANTYTGVTTVTAGTLQVNASNGISGDIVDNSALVFNTSAAWTYAGTISGTGTFQKTGTGNLVITGAVSTSGTTTVAVGVLQVRSGTDGGLTGSISGAIVNNASVVFNPADAMTVASNISGTGALTKSGTGDLFVSGSFSYTGGTTLSRGNLYIGTTGGSTGALLGAVATASGTTFGYVRTGASTFSAVISGAGDVSKAGTGTWTLSGANTYTGTTTVSAGTLVAANATALGAVSGGTTVADGATLSLSGGITVGAEALTISGAGVAGVGALTSQGAGTNQVQGAITLAGNSTITLQGTSSLVLSGGITGANTDLTLGTTSGNGGTASGVIDIGSGAITKTGNGQWTLSAANTYTGLTTVAAGTLNITNSQALGTADNGTVVGSGASLALGGGVNVVGEALNLSGAGVGSFGALLVGSGSATYGGAITLAADSKINSGLLASPATLTLSGGITGSGKTLTLGGPGTGTISAAIATDGGALTKIDAGTWTLSADNSYTGVTTISGGKLQIGNGGTAGSIADTGGIINNGALVFDRSNAITYGGIISGTGTLEKAGAGTLTLTGANTTNGATTVSAGTLALSGGSLGGSVTVASGATLTGGTSAGSVAGAVTISAGGTLAATTGTTSLSMGALTFAAPTSIFSLTLGGSLTPAAVSVAGNLTLDGVLNLSTPSGFASGTYRLIDYVGSLNDQGMIVGAAPSHSLFSIDTSVANQVNLIVTAGQWWNGAQTSPSGGPVTGGSGTWTVGAATNWTDQTGTTASAWSQNGIAIFAGATGGTVTVSGTPPQVAGLEFLISGYKLTGGSIALAARSGQTKILVGENPGDTAMTASIASVLTGTTGLEKTGAGTLILTATNGYSGGTTISAGTLMVGDGVVFNATLGSGPIVNNAALAFNVANGFGVVFNDSISGTGTLQKLGRGTLNLTAANSYSGATLVSEGTLTLSALATLGTGTVGTTVASGATLAIYGITTDEALTLSGTGASGAGALNAGIASTVSGAITLAADSTITVDSGATLTLSGGITGAGQTVTFGGEGQHIVSGVIATGTGRVTLLTGFNGGELHLSAANTYTGATNVLWGNLYVENTQALGTTAGNTVVEDGASVFLALPTSGTNTVAENFVISGSGRSGTEGAIANITGTNTLSGTITLAADALIRNAASGGSLTLSGGITGAGKNLTLASSQFTNVVTGAITTGSGSVTLAAGSIWVFTAANTYTGGTIIDTGGVLSIGDGGTTGSVVGDIVNGGGLRFNRSDDIAFAGIISGTGVLTKQGAGTLTLSGSNTYSGVTRIAAGTLSITNSTALGATTGGTTVSAGATLQLSGNIAVGAEALTLSGNGVFDAGLSGYRGALYNAAGSDSYAGAITLSADSRIVNAATLTLSGGITGAGKNLTLDDLGAGGTATISGGITTGTGSVTILGGTWIYASNANSYTGTTTLSGGTLQIGDGGTVGAITGNVVNNASLIFNRADAVTYAGIVSGSGSLTKLGADVLTLTGANTYTGGTTVAAGTLEIGAGGLAGAVAGAIANSGTVVFNRSDDIVAGGAVTGTGALVQRGAGTLTLAGANSAGGGTTVEAGTLELLAGASLTSEVLVRAGATLKGETSGTSGAAVTGAVTVQDGGTLLAGPSTGLGQYGLSMTTLTLSDAANLSVVLGSNTGNGAFSAGTLALDGVLNVTNGGAMALGVYRILDYTTLASDNGLQLGTTPLQFAYEIQQAPGQVNLAVLNGGMLYWNGTQTTPDGTIHGGSGTWTSSASDTNWTTAPANQSRAWDATFAVFSGTPGNVTIDTTPGAVSVTGVQFMVDGYRVTGGALTLAAASGPTPIRVGDGTSAGANYVATIAAEIAGNTGLEKTDLGTLILTGANSYTGTTTITQGTLQIGDGGSTGAIQGDVVNNAALVFNRGDTVAFSGSISGTGTLTKQGAGTLTLTGANSFSGGTAVVEGTLQLSAASALGSGGLRLSGGSILRASDTFSYSDAISLTPVAGVGGGTFEVDASKTLTLAGTIGGTGSLSKTGTGTLVIGGTNTSSGSTTVNAGTLVATGGQAIGDASVVTVASGAQLILQGNESVGSIAGSGALGLDGATLTTGGNNASSVFSGAIGGTGGLTKTGTGTLTLLGASSYSGGTTVSDGTLQVYGADALGTGPLALAGAAILQASETFTDARAISLSAASGLGGGTLAVDETKTLTLSGAITGLGDLTKTGAGALVLSGTNSASGAVAVATGTLIATGGQAIGDTSAVSVASGAQFIVQGDEVVGSITGSGALMLNGASLTAGGSNASTAYDGLISGTGGLTKAGTGTLTLSGANTYTGDTTVVAGGLAVAGSLNGDTYVQNLATLTGTGSISGTVHVLDGGTLVGAQGTGLTMGGLDLASAAQVNVTLGAVSGGGVFTVNGDVTLGGTLNVTAGPSFGIGIYRLMTYSGALTDTGMIVAPLEGGLDGGVQTSVANQVNLFVEDPNTPILFWNGTHTTPTQNILGGSGTWTADAQTNWINASGVISRSWNSGFAVFQGTPGTVTVDNSAGQITTTGLQFVDSGYVVTGGAIALSGSQPTPIRVGDGTVTGSAAVATIASELTGIGGLEKTDYGTLILAGANSYTGGTVISGGTLQLGNGGSTGSILGDVSNAGVLAFNRNNDTTFAGSISGTGAVVQSGPGTTFLTGSNSYSGGTTIASGTLRVAGADALGSGSLTVGGGGTLRASGTFTYGGPITLGNSVGASVQPAATAATFAVDAAQTLTLSGVLSGAAGLTKAGDGVLILTGANTYSGMTTVSAGTLQIGNGGTVGSIAGDVVNNANLVFNRSDTYAFTGSITGNGAVTFTGGGTVLFSAPYTGPVAVSATVVELQVGSNTSSPFTVNTGGVLGGTASIGGLIVNSGGTAAPGYSPGTLTVNGTVAFNAGSVYSVDVTPAGAHDLITATGNVTLSSGASVQVVAVPGTYAANSTLTILSTSATVTGTFGSVSSNYAFLQPQLSYDAQNVYLSLLYTGIDFVAYAQTPNQAGAAVAAQALGAGNPVFDAIVSLPNGTVAPALDQLTGEIYPSISTVIQQEAVYLREAVGARLRQSVTPGAGTALSEAAQAAGPANTRLSRDLTPTLWMQGYGGWGNSYGTTNAATISNTLGGFLAGLDVGVTDNVRAGVVAGFSQSQLDVNARNSSGSMDNYDIGLYAGGQFGAFALRGGVSYTWHDVAVARSVAFSGFSGSTTGGYNVGATQVFGEVGYDVTVGSFALEPFAGLAYLNVSGGALSESGLSGAALNVNLGAMDTLYSTLGLRAATSVMLGGRALTPSVTLGWQHAFGDTTPSATMQFMGGTTPFQVTGVPVAQDAMLVGAGLAYALSDLATLQVTYTGQIAAEASQNAFTAQLSVKF